MASQGALKKTSASRKRTDDFLDIVCHKTTDFADSEEVFRACVNFAVAQVAQAARDLLADTKTEGGMTKYQIERRRENEINRRDALRWVKYPDTGKLSLSSCVDYINQSLHVSDRPEIPLRTIRKTLLENPKQIAEAFPQGWHRDGEFDDLDYLGV